MARTFFSFRRGIVYFYELAENFVSDTMPEDQVKSPIDGILPFLQSVSAASPFIFASFRLLAVIVQFFPRTIETMFLFVVSFCTTFVFDTTGDKCQCESIQSHDSFIGSQFDYLYLSDNVFTPMPTVSEQLPCKVSNKN